MAAGWKVRRELVRVGQQARGLLERFTDPAAQKRLDSAVSAGLPMVEGSTPLHGKVALFLVWQQGGLARSALETCRWLVDAGYAPLDHIERTAVARSCWTACRRRPVR